MGLITKKVFSIMALCVMVSLLLLPVVVSIPSPAAGEEPAADAAKKEGDKVEKGRGIFLANCAGCHAPKQLDEKGLVVFRLSTLEEAGTDPNDAKRTFKAVKERMSTNSPVYPRIRQLERTFE